MSLKNTIYMETQDKVKIVGDVVLPDDDIENATLLLHMMPATRTSYTKLQDALAVCGTASLAIDLRGHGESVLREGSETVLDYTLFTNEEHQHSILDVFIAYAQLRELTHVDPKHTSVVGASIGASLALQFVAINPEVPLAVLLSPGLRYKGIDIEPLIGKIKEQEQKVVTASSEEDVYSLDAQKKIGQLLGSSATLYQEEGEAHGTDLFGREEFAYTIIKHICNAL